MLSSYDRLDKTLIRTACVIIPILLAVNGIALVLLYDAHADVAEALKEESKGNSVEDPAYFKSVIETFVRFQYRDRKEYINSINVEWSVDRNICDYQGQVVIDSRTIGFFGKMVKFNTGWKMISFDED